MIPLPDSSPGKGMGLKRLTWKFPGGVLNVYWMKRFPSVWKVFTWSLLTELYGQEINFGNLDLWTFLTVVDVLRLQRQNTVFTFAVFLHFVLPKLLTFLTINCMGGVPHIHLARERLFLHCMYIDELPSRFCGQIMNLVLSIKKVVLNSRLTIDGLIGHALYGMRNFLRISGKLLLKDSFWTFQLNFSVNSLILL